MTASTIDADVQHKFTTDAAFLGAVKPGMAAIKSDVKKLAYKHLTAGTVAFEVSDDSLLAHLAELISTSHAASGDNLLGVHGDSFSVLTGDTTLKALLKALDTYLLANTEAKESSGNIVVDTSAQFVQASTTIKWFKKGSVVHLWFPSFAGDRDTAATATLTLTPGTGWSTIKSSGLCVIPIIVNEAGVGDIACLLTLGNTTMTIKKTGGATFANGVLVSWGPLLVSFYPEP